MIRRPKISFALLFPILFSFLAGCSRPALVPDQLELDAEVVWVGESEYLGTVSWSNDSLDPISVSPPPTNTAAPGFIVSASSTAARILAPRDKANLSFWFAPPDIGTYESSAALIINTKPMFTKIKPVMLKGVGVYRKNYGALSLGGGYLVTSGEDTGPLEFGDVVIGSFSTRTIVIENQSDQDIHARVDLVRDNTMFWTAAMTTMGDHLKTVDVPKQGSITIVVTFEPNKEGEYQDVLVITDTNNGANLAGIVMRGTGVADLN